jgi:hypothetical protein
MFVKLQQDEKILAISNEHLMNIKTVVIPFTAGLLLIIVIINLLISYYGVQKIQKYTTFDTHSDEYFSNKTQNPMIYIKHPSLGLAWHIADNATNGNNTLSIKNGLRICTFQWISSVNPNATLLKEVTSNRYLWYNTTTNQIELTSTFTPSLVARYEVLPVRDVTSLQKDRHRIQMRDPVSNLFIDVGYDSANDLIRLAPRGSGFFMTWEQESVGVVKKETYRLMDTSGRCILPQKTIANDYVPVDLNGSDVLKSSSEPTSCYNDHALYEQNNGVWKHVYSDLCIQPQGNSTADGTPLVLGPDCSARISSGENSLVHEGSQKCLNVNNNAAVITTCANVSASNYFIKDAVLPMYDTSKSLSFYLDLNTTLSNVPSKPVTSFAFEQSVPPERERIIMGSTLTEYMSNMMTARLYGRFGSYHKLTGLKPYTIMASENFNDAANMLYDNTNLLSASGFSVSFDFQIGKNSLDIEAGQALYFFVGASSRPGVETKPNKGFIVAIVLSNDFNGSALGTVTGNTMANGFASDISLIPSNPTQTGRGIYLIDKDYKIVGFSKFSPKFGWTEDTSLWNNINISFVKKGSSGQWRIEANGTTNATLTYEMKFVDSWINKAQNLWGIVARTGLVVSAPQKRASNMKVSNVIVKLFDDA